MGLGAPELLLVLLISLGAAIAVLATALPLPDTAFRSIGQSKTLWIVLPIVGLLFCGVVSVVAAIVWFTTVRPKVAAAAAH